MGVELPVCTQVVRSLLMAHGCQKEHGELCRRLCLGFSHIMTEVNMSSTSSS